MGRPRLARRRDRALYLRLYDEERELIERAAELVPARPPEYARMVLLDAARRRLARAGVDTGRGADAAATSSSS